jgi:hypothetical protein
MMLPLMRTLTCIALGELLERNKPAILLSDILSSRAGRFGTKGLAITFVSSDGDQQVMDAIQARFEVAMTELPDSIDPASYSESLLHPSSKDSQCAEPCPVTS